MNTGPGAFARERRRRPLRLPPSCARGWRVPPRAGASQARRHRPRPRRAAPPCGDAASASGGADINALRRTLRRRFPQQSRDAVDKTRRFHYRVAGFFQAHANIGADGVIGERFQIVGLREKSGQCPINTGIVLGEAGKLAANAAMGFLITPESQPALAGGGAWAWSSLR